MSSRCQMLSLHAQLRKPISPIYWNNLPPLEVTMNTLEPVLNDPPATAPQSELRRGAVAALPVLLGFIPFALVLGAQASQQQLAAGEVALMTGLNFGVARSLPPSNCGPRHRQCW